MQQAEHGSKCKRDIVSGKCILREVTKVHPKSETIKGFFANILMIQDSFEISSVMNEYFSTVGERLASDFHDDSDTTNP